MAQTFEELIGVHLDDLYSAALCFTQDARFAEELLQEASIRAFHEFARLPQGPDFRVAMLGILVSTYLQRRRRQGHDPLAGHVDFPELVEFVPQHEIEPFPEPGTPIHRLLVQLMNRAWSELDDGDRVVLWLADIERIRHKRLAAMTQISEEAVKVRHYRARAALSRAAARGLASQSGRAGSR